MLPAGAKETVLGLAAGRNDAVGDSKEDGGFVAATAFWTAEAFDAAVFDAAFLLLMETKIVGLN